MPTGTVKWFNTTKGFGFNQPDAGAPDMFVHTTAVRPVGRSDLAEGLKVSCELVADKRSERMSAEQLNVH